MRKIAVSFTLLTLLAVGAFAQNPPTLRIVTEDPTLPSELFYGDIKVKPLRLRPGTNPPVRITIDDSDFFVQQHYVDFLSRFPEQAGFNSWMSYLNTCAVGDPACLQQARITTSAAFFGSQEFQLKGFFVFRFYKDAFSRLPNYPEMTADMRAVTGQTQAEVYQKKAAFTNAFVQRPEFMTAYGGLTNDQYVAALMSHYSLAQITTPNPAAPDGTNKVTLTTGQLQSQLGGGTLTRAQVLRAIADSDQVSAAEYNPAFVYIEYVGYLRRAPEPQGYSNWLTYLNAHPTDYRTMVWGFMASDEYRNRF
jgi:hypothetical protein